MANISDIIETFLIEMLGESESVNISRNELANYFSCAPSQINYVLTTRFTPARGFVIESRRGGGGFVSVARVENSDNEVLKEIMSTSIADGISQAKMLQYLERMVANKLILPEEGRLLASIMSDRALISPMTSKDELRVCMLKSLVMEIMKRGNL